MSAAHGSRRAIKSHNTSIDGCHECKHHQPTNIFELCAHPKSIYSINGVNDFHTCQHMREEYGLCGHELRLKSK